MITKSHVASSVPYDNSASPLTAEDVQGALDELANAVASGITNYKITSSTPFSTSSTTDVVITGFTITPVAGTYACFYNANVLYTTTPRYHWWSIYLGGSQISTSQRSQITSRSNQGMFDATIATFTANGSEAVDVRVRRDPSGGALTVNQRTLVLIRLGP